MRAVQLGVLLVVGALASSCSESAAASVPGEGTLVLELGGPQGSLRAALAAAGIAMGPPQRLREVEPDPPVVDGPGDVVAPTPDGAGPVPEPSPAPAPEADVPQWKTVTLKRGQTLIHVAKEHLGNGNRFRELLELNGWTEADARRLPEGAKVRVPVGSKDRRSAR